MTGPGLNDPATRARALLSGGSETRNFDVKGPIAWPQKTSRARYELVRDILAFSNTPDGGTILIGVAPSTHVVLGMDDTGVKTWDTTKVAQGCAVFGSPPPLVHVCYPIVDGKQLVMLEIAPFAEVPTVCREEAKEGSVVILRKAGLYIRTSMAQTVEIHDEEQIRSLIEQAMNRKAEHLLAQIRGLVGPPPSPERPHPYDAMIDNDLEVLRRLVG